MSANPERDILINALRALVPQPEPQKGRRPLLNGQDAARYLGVSKHVFTRLVGKGDIPQIKYEDNSLAKYDPDDLDQYIENHKGRR